MVAGYKPSKAKAKCPESVIRAVWPSGRRENEMRKVPDFASSRRKCLITASLPRTSSLRSSYGATVFRGVNPLNRCFAPRLKRLFILPPHFVTAFLVRGYRISGYKTPQPVLRTPIEEIVYVTPHIGATHLVRGYPISGRKAPQPVLRTPFDGNLP